MEKLLGIYPEHLTGDEDSQSAAEENKAIIIGTKCQGHQKGKLIGVLPALTNQIGFNTRGS